MGATLNPAAAMDAYTLSDRGTWLAFAGSSPLELLVEGDPRLANPYSAVVVNPDRHPHVNSNDARRLIEWLTSDEGQQAIASYRIRAQVPFHSQATEDEGALP